MAKIWAKRLEDPDDKYNNFHQVPPSLQNQTRTIIENDGYQILIDGTVVPAN